MAFLWEKITTWEHQTGQWGFQHLQQYQNPTHRIVYIFLYSPITQRLCNKGFRAGVGRGESRKAVQQEWLH